MNFPFLAVFLLFAKRISTSQNYNISDLYNISDCYSNSQYNNTATNITAGFNTQSDTTTPPAQYINIDMNNFVLQLLYNNTMNLSIDQIMQRYQETTTYYAQRRQEYDAQIASLEMMKALEAKQQFEMNNIYQVILVQKLGMAQQNISQNVQVSINNSISVNPLTTTPSIASPSGTPNVLEMPLLLNGNSNLSPSNFDLPVLVESGTDLPKSKSTGVRSSISATSSSSSSSLSLPSSPLLGKSATRKNINKSFSPRSANKKVRFFADIEKQTVEENEAQQPPAKKREIEKEEAEENIKALKELSPGIKGHVLIKHALDEYKKKL